MFEHIVEQIKKHDSIVIFGHINPDGDCYGSQVGLRDLIKALYPNKKVYITGTGCPRFFNILPNMDLVSDEIIANSLAILVDGNDLSRMEDSRVSHALAWAKIDHHIDTGTFSEGPFVVITEASSTCEIITHMAIELNIDISPVGATALYLGLLTDSARFQFVNDFNLTFEATRYLYNHGANIPGINEDLAKTDERTLAAKGYVLSHYKKSKGGVIYNVFTKEELKGIDLSANAASNMINLIGNVDGYPIWCSFAEYENGKVRFEVRSNGPIIQPCAARVGGGGHAHASGATLPSLDPKLIDSIIKDLENTIDEWREE